MTVSRTGSSSARQPIDGAPTYGDGVAADDEGRGPGNLILIAGAAIAVVVVVQVVAWVVGAVAGVVRLAALLVVVAVAVRLALRR
jgi:hypothetical protein